MGAAILRWEVNVLRQNLLVHGHHAIYDVSHCEHRDNTTRVPLELDRTDAKYSELQSLHAYRVSPLVTSLLTQTALQNNCVQEK